MSCDTLRRWTRQQSAYLTWYQNEQTLYIRYKYKPVKGVVFSYQLPFHVLCFFSCPCNNNNSFNEYETERIVVKRTCTCYSYSLIPLKPRLCPLVPSIEHSPVTNYPAVKPWLLDKQQQCTKSKSIISSFLEMFPFAYCKFLFLLFITHHQLIIKIGICCQLSLLPTEYSVFQPFIHKLAQQSFSSVQTNIVTLLRRFVLKKAF